MRISVFGLGYVGAVSAVAMARLGHRVVGVDVVPDKVEQMNAGIPPVSEPGVEEALEKGLEQDRIFATGDSEAAVADTDVSLICVGTPNAPDGSLDASAIRRVGESIGSALDSKDDDHTVVVRSTTTPGTIRDHLIPALARGAGGELPDGIAVLSNPEFLREGSALQDFFDPPQIVIGGERSAAESFARAYEKIDAPVRITSLEVAEAIKLVSNAFHALKICFANEVGNTLAEADVDPVEVMELFCQDTTLNISRKYLRPGFAFGGSCLPKDVRALVGLAESHQVRVPMLQNVTASNEVQIQRAFRHIRELGKRRVGLLGLAFKPDTDDLRESPYVALAEILLGKGFEVSVYDANLKLGELVGSNLEYLRSTLPHIGRMLRNSPEEVARECDVLVVCHETEEIQRTAESAEDCEVVYLERPLTLGDHHDKVPIFSNAVASFGGSE